MNEMMKPKKYRVFAFIVAVVMTFSALSIAFSDAFEGQVRVDNGVTFIWSETEHEWIEAPELVIDEGLTVVLDGETENTGLAVISGDDGSDAVVADSSFTVTGNVELEAEEVQNLKKHDDNIFVTAVSANSYGGEEASITINGNVISDVVNTDAEIYSIDNKAVFTYALGEGSTTDVTVTGNAVTSIDTTGIFGNGIAVEAEAHSGGKNKVEIDGKAIATANASSFSSEGTAVISFVDGDGAQNDVTVGKGAEGRISASVWGHSTNNITVEEGGVNAYNNSVGISNNTGTANVNITGDVMATQTAVNVGNGANWAWAAMSVEEVEALGDVYKLAPYSSNGYDYYEYCTDDAEYYYFAKDGVIVTDDESLAPGKRFYDYSPAKTTLTVNGDIISSGLIGDANTKATINGNAAFEGTNTLIKVNGTVSTEATISDGRVSSLNLSSSEKADLQAIVTGAVSMNAFSNEEPLPYMSAHPGSIESGVDLGNSSGNLFVSVGGIDVKGDGTAKTYGARSEAAGANAKTQMTVNGNIDVSNGTSPMNSTTGIYVKSGDGAYSNLTVTGNTIVSGDVSWTTQAIDIRADGKNSKSEALINGSITTNDMGLDLTVANGGTVNAKMTGDIESSEGAGFFEGVRLNGNEGAGKVSLNYTGNISAVNTAEYADGMRILLWDGDESAEAIITGDITGSNVGEFAGITTSGFGEGNSITVNQTGKISAKANVGTGIDAGVTDHATADISISDGIIIDAEKGVGFRAVSQGGDTELNIEVLDGGVTFTGEDGTAIEIQQSPLAKNIEGDQINISVNGDVASGDDGLLLTAGRKTINTEESPVPVNENEFISCREYDGKIERVYYSKEGKYYYNGDGVAWTVPEENNAESNVLIKGDLSAKESGIVLDQDVEVDNSVIIDGTLSGGKQAVLIKEGSVAENLTLTVWKIVENKDSNLIENETIDPETKEKSTIENKDAEKAIQYIIRIRPDQKDIISTRGTTTYEGYDVAREGDTVTLKLNVPYGYEISGAYRDAGQELKLLQDAEGDYYLIVPRGGAVELSVTLKYVLDDVKSESDSGTAAVPESSGKVLFALDTPFTNDINPDKATYKPLGKDDNIIWLRESSSGTSAWYGIDNSEGALPVGSIISVRMYSKNEDPEMYIKHYNQANEGLLSCSMMVEDNKIRLFELNAYKENGGLLNNEFASGKNVKVYVELGADWDLRDIEALFVDKGGQPGTLLSKPQIEEKEINGAQKVFAVMKLNHFSTYAITDTKLIEME